jgi:indolepyruvate ferredoxin oxidoreductase beta subunit
MTETESYGITNIVIAGVGGQGIILASTLLSEAALLEGHDVKANEVHGMAQRGGSVICQIRYGEKVYSPLVKKGTAHFLLSLEIIESLRYADYLAPGGVAYINAQRIIPATVSSGFAEYPPDPESLIRKTFPQYKVADCLKLALEAGSARCVNIVMTGWLSNALPFSPDTWTRALESQMKSKYLEMNLKAFHLGKALG